METIKGLGSGRENLGIRKLESGQDVDKVQDAKLEKVTVKTPEDQNAIVESLEVETDPKIQVSKVSVRPDNSKNVSDVKVRPQNETVSPDQDFQEKNDGHWENKKKGFLFWGFLVCSAVLSFPLGGGFAFLLVPAQGASMGLCVFWKRGQKKVWVVDKSNNPGDKLLATKDSDTLGANVEGNDILNTIQEKSDILDTGQGKANEISKFLDSPDVQKELKAFSAALNILSDSGLKDVDPKTIEDLSKILSDPKQLESISGVIKSAGIANAMDKLAKSAELSPEERNAAANELAQNLSDAISKLPQMEGVISPELKEQISSKDSQFRQNVAKAMSNNAPKLKALNNVKGAKDSPAPKQSIQGISTGCGKEGGEIYR